MTVPQIEIDGRNAVFGWRTGRIRAKPVELCINKTENLEKWS